MSLAVGARARVDVPLADLRQAPAWEAPRLNQLLLGESVRILAVVDEEFAEVEAVLDGYRGFLGSDDLVTAEGLPPATHWVRRRRAHLYPEPNVKAAVVTPLPLLAQLTVARVEGAWAETADGAFVPALALAPCGAGFAGDPLTVALGFLGVPYLWGGRTAEGLDCSGLMQLAFAACGQAVPRDSGPQSRGLGRTLEPGERPRGGDLFFQPGHVGFVAGAAGDQALHANAAHMEVTLEPLEAAVTRVAAPTSFRRVG